MSKRKRQPHRKAEGNIIVFGIGGIMFFVAFGTLCRLLLQNDAPSQGEQYMQAVCLASLGMGGFIAWQGSPREFKTWGAWACAIFTMLLGCTFAYTALVNPA